MPLSRSSRECSRTGKVRFRDKLAAQIELAGAVRRDKGEQRAYRCEFCRGWHLTSQSKRRPSVRRGNGVQGSADPGEPTLLMQPQTRPVTR